MAEEKESGGAEWMQKYWRPAMGWMYMIICMLDMAIFPVLWSALQAFMHMPITQWNPLTLQGAGLFHIAMGAVLGISAFGRTQEKLAGTAANPTTTQTVTTNNNSSGGFGNGTQNTGGFGGGSTFGTPASGGFGANTGGFGSPAPSSGGFGSSPSPSPAGGGFGGSGFGATTTPAVTASGKKIVPTGNDPVL